MLSHQGTTRLLSERLILRPFARGDGKAMFFNWASDEYTVARMIWDLYQSEAQAERMVRQWVAAYHSPSVYHWAIVPLTVHRPIGSISVVRCQDYLETAEVGYCIGSRWWNQGYVSEALGMVMDFLFDQVGFHRIEARHDEENHASGRVMEKNGMKREGLLRGGYKRKDGIFGTMVLWGITAEDREKE